MPDINYSKERKKLLEQRLGPSNKLTWQENVLLKNKIVPLVTFAPLEKADPSDPDEETRHGQTAFLGKGQYGKVFRAAYKGKEVAVKVTTDEAEADNWITINQIVESAPPEVARHVPRIYQIIKDEDEYGDPIIIIVMEVLKPLSGHVKEKLFGQEGFAGPGGTQALGPASKRSRERVNKGKERSIAELMKDVNMLFEGFNRALNGVKTTMGIDLEAHIKQDLFKRIMDFKPLAAGAEPVLDFPIYVAAQLVQVVGALSPPEKEKYTTMPHPIPSIGYYIGDEIVKFLRETVKAGNFPWTADVPSEDRNIYQNIPEAKSLLDALEYLESYGVSWHDVHSGNIMVRPSTGDLVIVDVGLYKQ